MEDWIYLTYKIHNKLENMLIPDETNVPRTGWGNWVLYATILLYKFYTRDKSFYLS